MEESQGRELNNDHKISGNHKKGFIKSSVLAYISNNITIITKHTFRD
jgi:hypothetical protein